MKRAGHCADSIADLLDRDGSGCSTLDDREHHMGAVGLTDILYVDIWQAANGPKQSLVNHFYHPTIHGLSVSMVCA